ncbi:MAG: putative DNA binding domain-containing protein [Elusimicrobia bacterium]|nr:putative DNA binding domain-containing protein [Elusimicrobiota bacterium]
MTARLPAASEFALALSAWEGQFVEFKESVSDSLAREFVAFANSAGGRIFVGVADDKQIKGVAVTNRLLSQVVDIARHCDPPVSVRVVPFKHEGHGLLMIEVAEGKHKPHGCASGYFLRTGPNSQKLNRHELVEFVRSLEPVIVEHQDCPAFRYPADFDEAAFRAFLRESGASVGGLSAEDLLINLGCGRRQGRRLVLNNAGALFFAKNPPSFLPQARVACVLFQTPERLHILDRKDLEGGLLENLQQAEVFLLKHLRVRYEIRGMDRVEHPEFPVAVLREGLVNAFAHRDYSVRGGNISIEVFPDRVAIVNPGGLPPGLSPEDFGRRSVRRNPLVADLLFRAHKIERTGTGIGRMRDALAQAKCAAPEFRFTSFFELLLARRPAAGGQVGGKWGASGGQVSPRDRTILQFCKTPRFLKEIMVEIGIKKRDHAMPCVKSLIESGLLAPTVPDRPRSRIQKYATTTDGVKCLGNAA